MNRKINNDIKKHKLIDRTAVALSYDPEEVAPKVIATGRNYIADKILNNAKDYNIPIHKDAELVDSLSKVELGAHIPTELYEVVAEVLIFIDQMDKIKGKIHE